MEQSGDKTARCLCGLCKVTTGSVIIGITEILVVSHALIFAFANYFAGEVKYEKYNPVFAAVIKYDYLLPFLIIQVVWIVSNVILFIGIKGPFPWLILPHIAVQIIVIAGGTALSVVAFVNIGKAKEINWALGVSLSLCIAISLAQIYFVFIMRATYKSLKQIKVAVATDRQWLSFATMPQDAREDGGLMQAAQPPSTGKTSLPRIEPLAVPGTQSV